MTDNQAAIQNEMSQAEFARRRGVSRATVHEYKKKGYLALSDSGNVLVSESEAKLAVLLDQSRGGNRAPKPAAGGDKGSAFMSAKTREMEAKASKSELELREKAGELVSREAVTRAAFTLARDAQEALMAIPDRLASLAASETDEAKIHEMLTTEIRNVANELAKSAGEVFS